jgi:hypothetical protein
MNRRTFMARTAAMSGLSLLGPLHALGVRAAHGQSPVDYRLWPTRRERTRAGAAAGIQLPGDLTAR